MEMVWSTGSISGSFSRTGDSGAPVATSMTSYSSSPAEHVCGEPEMITAMHAIQALMNELVDYAGLFPPASLDMEATVRNYAGYRDSAAAPMLGRLIVPVSRFEEFDRRSEDLLPPVPDAEAADEDPDPWVISALVSSAADIEAVERDLEAIDAFNDRHASEGGGAAIVDTIELPAATERTVPTPTAP